MAKEKKEKKPNPIKKFFEEFKKFITRGNILDMAVGVIVGGAFTAIVNGLSNFILKPIINWLLAVIFGSNSLSGILTFLRYVPSAADPTVADLTQSIYIDWGSFINAIINFLLIAIVLFSIVKIINMIKDGNVKIVDNVKEKTLNRKEIKELKAAGVNVLDRKAVKAYFEEKKAKELAAEEEAKRIEEEKAKAERLANPTTEDLLKYIKALLEKSIDKSEK